jgi:hypothetical protein
MVAFFERMFYCILPEWLHPLIYYIRMYYNYCDVYMYICHICHMARAMHSTISGRFNKSNNAYLKLNYSVVPRGMSVKDLFWPLLEVRIWLWHLWYVRSVVWSNSKRASVERRSVGLDGDGIFIDGSNTSDDGRCLLMVATQTMMGDVCVFSSTRKMLRKIKLRRAICYVHSNTKKVHVSYIPFIHDSIYTYT